MPLNIEFERVSEWWDHKCLCPPTQGWSWDKWQKFLHPMDCAQTGVSHHQHIPIARQLLNPLQTQLAALGGLGQTGALSARLEMRAAASRAVSTSTGHHWTDHPAWPSIRVTSSTVGWGCPGSSMMSCSTHTTSTVPPTLSPSLSHGSSDDSGNSSRSCLASYWSENRQCLSGFVTAFSTVGLGTQMWSNCWKCCSSWNFTG